MATPGIEESGTETSSVMHLLKHTWLITNFSHFVDAERINPEYPSFRSVKFQCSQDERMEFYLELFPNGKYAESSEYISVYLHVQFKEEAQVQIECLLSLLNPSNEKAIFGGKSHSLKIVVSPFCARFY